MFRNGLGCRFLVGALLFTQGCAIGQLSELSFAQPCAPETKELAICVATQSHAKARDVPLLLHWQGNGAPFDLIVRINDLSGTYESVSIDSVGVEYADGGMSEFVEPQRLSFEPNSGLGFSQAAISYPALITRPRDGSVILTGELRTKEGKSCPLQARREFNVESDLEAIPYFTWLIYGIE